MVEFGTSLSWEELQRPRRQYCQMVKLKSERLETTLGVFLPNATESSHPYGGNLSHTKIEKLLLERGDGASRNRAFHFLAGPNVGGMGYKLGGIFQDTVFVPSFYFELMGLKLESSGQIFAKVGCFAKVGDRYLRSSESLLVLLPQVQVKPILLNPLLVLNIPLAHQTPSRLVSLNSTSSSHSARASARRSGANEDRYEPFLLLAAAVPRIHTTSPTHHVSCSNSFGSFPLRSAFPLAVILSSAYPNPARSRVELQSGSSIASPRQASFFRAVRHALSTHAFRPTRTFYATAELHRGEAVSTFFKQFFLSLALAWFKITVLEIQESPQARSFSRLVAINPLDLPSIPEFRVRSAAVDLTFSPQRASTQSKTTYTTALAAASFIIRRVSTNRPSDEFSVWVSAAQMKRRLTTSSLPTAHLPQSLPTLRTT
ncbi:hypothetical protein FB451DRAFT_1173112 [Mycena latifolia]|nr:hypothetical protein FB451DRAFT_1173112 [Mycena latifolia]